MLDLWLMKADAQRYVDDGCRWAAVSRRDKQADGAFFYAVRTTGIFCRPGCASRLPLRRNVRFFDTVQAATADGFRPCKRCRPNLGRHSAQLQNDERLAIVCEAIETSQGALSLDEMANLAAMSRYHFHREFKRFTGITPKQYGDRRRSTQIEGCR